QRFGIGEGVHSTAHQEVPDHLTGNRVVRHFVHPHLLGTGTAFQEEVVQQVEDQVAAVEYVISAPGLLHGVGHRGRLSGCDEVVRVAQILRDFEASVAFILGGTGDAQVDRVGN